MLFKEGKSFSHFPFRVIYLEQENQLTALQAGFTVSTRHFKKAVDRNRIKRLMREAYRLQKNDLHTSLEDVHKKIAVFFLYTGNELPSYELVFEKFTTALPRIKHLVCGS
jgi:ribonuclease P protein component